MKQNMADGKGKQEGKNLHTILRDAWESIKMEGGSQLDSQLAQGRTIKAIANDFKLKGWKVDVYKALVVMSKEDPKAYSKYSARHLRHLGAFAGLYDEMATHYTTVPKVTMSHYLAVDVDALSLERKRSLLAFAEKYFWSVSLLKERILLELGIRVEKKGEQDKFGDALSTVREGVANLIKLMAIPCAEQEENNKRITALWRFNSLLAEYGRAFATIAPAAIQESALITDAGLVSPDTTPCTAQDVGDDDPDPDGGVGAIITVQVGNELDVIPIVLDRDEFQQAA